jgi:thiosulfate dehydrogenase (quinone) large subunit
MQGDVARPTDDGVRTRRLIALVAALIGGYLLTVATETNVSAGAGFWALTIGTIIFVATLIFLIRHYHPGVDEVSADEVGRASEWKVARFVRRAREAAPLYLGIRMFAAYEWLGAGWHKLRDDAWMDGGTALQGFWRSAAAVPQQGAPKISYPVYRSIIQFMLDNEWYTWFAKLIAVGECLIGLGLLFGGLAGIAAAFALLMNFSFIYAGSTSSNPTMILISAVIIFGWRVAGWWGLDRFLLPLLSTPWDRAREVPRAGGVAPRRA